MHTLCGIELLWRHSNNSNKCANNRQRHVKLITDRIRGGGGVRTHSDIYNSFGSVRQGEGEISLDTAAVRFVLRSLVVVVVVVGAVCLLLFLQQISFTCHILLFFLF